MRTAIKAFLLFFILATSSACSLFNGEEDNNGKADLKTMTALVQEVDGFDQTILVKKGEGANERRIRFWMSKTTSYEGAKELSDFKEEDTVKIQARRSKGKNWAVTVKKINTETKKKEERKSGEKRAAREPQPQNQKDSKIQGKKRTLHKKDENDLGIGTHPGFEKP